MEGSRHAPGGVTAIYNLYAWIIYSSKGYMSSKV